MQSSQLGRVGYVEEVADIARQVAAHRRVEQWMLFCQHLRRKPWKYYLLLANIFPTRYFFVPFCYIGFARLGTMFLFLLRKVMENYKKSIKKIPGLLPNFG